jgi:hypothetical protein
MPQAESLWRVRSLKDYHAKEVSRGMKQQSREHHEDTCTTLTERAGRSRSSLVVRVSIALALIAALVIGLPHVTASSDDLLRLRLFYSTDFHGALEPCG